MAQTGFTPISNYYSATATNVPTAGNLVAGELAINTADGKLFYKDSAGVVQTIATKASAALGGSTTGSGAVVLATSPTVTTPTIDKINTSVANTSLGAGNASIMKNRIINGAMVIDQRNAGASVTPTGYTLDRWTVNQYPTTGKFSVQQNAGSVTPPTGFNYYLGATSLSAYSIVVGDIYSILQPIEGYNVADLGWGTANAKTVTLSFQVRSSLTGTFGGAIQNSANNRSYPFSYSIPVANTWTSISVTIAGDTTGTWLTTNGIGMYVVFGLGIGSDRSGTAGSWAGADYRSATGATSVVGTNGATFYITGVQLEVGSSATGFEYVNYQTSLANCQRYYFRFNATAAYSKFGFGWARSSARASILVNFPVQMRTNPSTFDVNTASQYVFYSGADYTASAIAVDQLSLYTASLNVTVSGATANQPGEFQSNGVTTSYLGFGAEL